MIKKNRILALLFLACAGVSFLYYIYKDRVTLRGLTVPINVNIELDKAYSNSFALVNKPSGHAVRFLPTHPNKLQKIVIHARVTELVEGIYVRIPLRHPEQAIASIDNVSVFLGNKLFYFNSSDITKWEYTAQDGWAYYTIPIESYTTSLIKPWINWYGDLSFIFRELIALITQPGRFILVYLFGLAAFLLLGRETNKLLKTQNKKIEIVLLLVLITFGFLFRMGELAIKQSAWVDELYSLHFSGSRVPLNTTVLGDVGNPPLYYLVLRLWFVIFGWSETTGRLLSVFFGTAGIIVLYWFVKPFCGKKHAFASAFLLAVGYSSVGFSIEMRSYTLLMVLALCTAKCFFLYLEKQTLKRNCIYAVMGVLLVNTHFFGSLFIAGNFFFYLKYNRHVLDRRNILHFLAVNFIIALSLVPYFYFSTYQFIILGRWSTWIQKPGKKDFLWPSLFFLLYIVSIILTLRGKKNTLTRNKKYILLDYSFFIILFISFSALLISLRRPFFHQRYLNCCYPFIMIITATSFFIDYGITFRMRFHDYKSLAFPVITLALVFVTPNFISVRLRYFVRGLSDIYRESQEYINLDSKNYGSATEIVTTNGRYPFYEVYNLIELPRYSRQNHCEVVYMNPFNKSQKQMDDQLLHSELNLDNVLKIRTGNANRPPIYKVLMNP